MMRGQVFRYAGWQGLDWALPRLLASLFLSLAVLWAVSNGLKNGAPAGDQLLKIMLQVHQQIMYLVVILFLHGIVSQDRVQGFFRFYLAKPASPLWFYAQKLLVTFAGVFAASAGFVVIGSLLIKKLWPWEAVGHTVAILLVFGMLMFVYGTLSRHDWLWAILTVLLASALRNQWPAAQSTWGRVLEAVLPPNQFIGGAEHPTHAQWAWMAGWAVGLFALALFLLRVRPLGED